MEQKDKQSLTKVCYILSYYSPNYIRTKVLLSALRLGRDYTIYEARNKSKNLFRYMETLLKLISVRVKYNPDIYILGFRGHEIFLPVRMITLGKKLIFDEFMSPYDSFVGERKSFKKDSMVAKFIYNAEKIALKLSDVILTDTSLHKSFISDLFQINPDKIYAVAASTDEDTFKVQKYTRSEDSRQFKIFFYGTFLPLHGVKYILEAAKLLEDKDIHFTIVGGKGRTLSQFKKLMKKIKPLNVTHKKWVEFEELPRYIGSADLCLGGPFGNTGQAKRIITGKTFQFLSMSKPTVIGKIDADYGFIHKKNCLLINQGDSSGLAEVIIWAHRHQNKLRNIGKQGMLLYQSKFSSKKIAQEINAIIEKLL